MKVDNDTLADLELIPSNYSSDTFFQSLDHTITPGGRLALRKYFRTPLETVSEIQQRQTSLKHLIPHIPLLGNRELASLIYQVEKYTSSSWVPLPQLAINRIIFRFRYSDMADEIERGISSLAELLDFAQTVGDCIEAFPLELIEMHSLATKIRECVELPLFIQLKTIRRRKGIVQRGLSRFDKPIREDSNIRAHLRNCIDALHDLDALRSMAIVSSQVNWTFPKFTEDRKPIFEATELVHPMIKNGVSNDIAIGSPGKVLYLTGPNMAGKSTFIKSCAIATLFSHMGMAVPAKTLRISLYQRLYTALTTKDSITRSESYYLAEVRRVKTLVEYISRGESVFAAIDEMFKGTNTLDAAEGTNLVVEGLARSHNSVFIIASHITSITENLVKNVSVKLSCFDGDIDDNDILHFDYQIKTGVSERRLGIELLKRENIIHLLGSIN